MKYRCEKCDAILNNSDLARIEGQDEKKYVHEWCEEDDEVQEEAGRD